MKRSHLEIHQSILLFFSRSALRRYYLTEPNRLGFISLSALGEGKSPIPAHSGPPVPPEGGEDQEMVGGGVSLRSTPEAHHPGAEAHEKTETESKDHRMLPLPPHNSPRPVTNNPFTVVPSAQHIISGYQKKKKNYKTYYGQKHALKRLSKH